MDTYQKLDPEIKASWLANLRSGDYAQTRGLLRRDVAVEGIPAGYCCLGVLADSIIESPLGEGMGWMKTDNRDLGGYFGREGVTNRFSDDVTAGTLPDWIREVIGLDSNAADHLIRMNDRFNRSFDEIATWVEENL